MDCYEVRRIQVLEGGGGRLCRREVWVGGWDRVVGREGGYVGGVRWVGRRRLELR